MTDEGLFLDSREEDKAMWIFTNKGFLSIVRHADKPKVFIVRSRFQGHIESIFPKAHVIENPLGDYRYRAQLPAKEVSERISAVVLGIDYESFKDSLDARDMEYLACCIDVYHTVANYAEADPYEKEDRDYI